MFESNKRNPYRVLHIIGSMQVGGAETMLYRLLNEESPIYSEICLVALTDVGYLGTLLKEKNIQIHEIKIKKNLSAIFGLVKLWKIIRNFNPDVVHAWMYHSCVVSLLMQKLHSSKFFLVWNIRHCLHDMQSEKLLTKWVIKCCRVFSRYVDKIVYNSQQALQQHLKYGFNPKQQSIVIYNGFDANFYRRNTDSQSMLKNQLNLSDDTKFIGLVGRYHPVKGIEVFLDAAKTICASRQDVVFLLVGKNMDEENIRLKNHLKNRGLNSQVHLLGQQEDIVFFMSCLDILVNTSYSESFSNVIAEALLCEAACVATNVGDAKLILGEQGVLVESGDAQGVAEAVLSFLLMDREKIQEIRLSARNRIKQQFSVDAVVKRYLEVNLQMLEHQG